MEKCHMVPRARLKADAATMHVPVLGLNCPLPCRNNSLECLKRLNSQAAKLEDLSEMLCSRSWTLHSHAKSATGPRHVIRQRFRLSPEKLTRRRRSRAILVSHASQEKPPAVKATYVTQPLQAVLEKQLLPLDSTNTPLWSTFCGLTNGVWRGKAAAFFAASGEAEAVYLDGKKPVKDIHTLVVEDRTEDDVVLRKILRSPSLSDIENATMQHSEGSQQDQAWEAEEIRETEEGLAIFDGGTFSRGPQWLLHPSGSESPAAVPTRSADEVTKNLLSQNGLNGDLQADGLAAEPDWGEDDRGKEKVSVIEQCLAFGGERRLRLQVTVSVGVEDGEMDVEILRLVLWSESWQGLAEACAVDKCIDENTQAAEEVQSNLSEAPRPAPETLEGNWKAYDISAVPVKEEDPLSGEQSSIMLYFNQEIEESWRIAKKGHTDSGAAIWLPNNTFLDIRMVRASSRGSTADKAEDMSNSPAAGLLLSFSWLVNPQTAISIHREYDGNGELLECRNRTAVNGGWVGGRM